MGEVKNCPHCGYGGNKLEMRTVEKHCEHWVACVNCGATGPNELTKVRAIETWNMRRDIYPCAQVNVDAYEDLQRATPEQLLGAVVWYYRATVVSPAVAEGMISFLCLGFQLAQPGGWQHVAPMWLRESKGAALDE